MARAVGARTSLRYLYYSPARLQNVSGRCVKASVHLAYLCGSSTSRQSQPNESACKAGLQKSFEEGGTSLLGTNFWRGSSGLGLHRAILGTFLKVGCTGSNTVENRRGFWTSPIMMGRRAAKIATRKGAQDKKKAKIYGRIGKQIITAVKAGGPDAKANVQLAAVLQTARQANIPKDIIDRNIKKASDKDQAEYVAQTYEVYGAGGVGIVVEAFTDNLNRAAANIRDAVKKAGGKMADPGSVLFNFERRGIISVYADDLEADDLLLAAMDAGADDVKLPEEIEEETEEEGSGRYKVVSQMDQFTLVKSKLAESSIHVDEENSGLELTPLAHIEVDDSAAEVNEAIIERLLDLDDVDSVFSNMAP